MTISGTNARVFFNQHKSSSYWSVRKFVLEKQLFHLACTSRPAAAAVFLSLSLTESAINKETTTTKWKPKRIRGQKGKSRKNPTTTNMCSEVKWSGLQNYKKAAGGGTTKVLISLHGWKSKLSGVIQGVATYIPAVSFIHKNCTYSTSDSNWCLAAVWQHLGRHTHTYTLTHTCALIFPTIPCACVCVPEMGRKTVQVVFHLWLYAINALLLSLLFHFDFRCKNKPFYRVGAPTTPVSLPLAYTHHLMPQKNVNKLAYTGCLPTPDARATWSASNANN